MSYDIFYDKQFIRIEDQFIPMIYGGSSNVREVSNGKAGRRSRDWFNSTYVTGGAYMATKEVILANVDKENANRAERAKEENEEYHPENFGWYTGLAIGGATTTKTSFYMYRTFIANGIKNALIVEELLMYGITIDVHSYYWDNKPYERTGLERLKEYPKSTAALVAVLEKAKEYKNKDIEVYISLLASEDTMKLLRRLRKQNKPKKAKKEIKDYYLFKRSDGGYFMKGKKNGYVYSYEADSYSHRQHGLTTANRRLNQLNKRYGEGTFMLEKREYSTPRFI